MPQGSLESSQGHTVASFQKGKEAPTPTSQKAPTTLIYSDIMNIYFFLLKMYKK